MAATAATAAMAMRIQVELLSGEGGSLEVAPDMTIRQLKEEVKVSNVQKLFFENEMNEVGPNILDFLRLVVYGLKVLDPWWSMEVGHMWEIFGT